MVQLLLYTPLWWVYRATRSVLYCAYAQKLCQPTAMNRIAPASQYLPTRRKIKPLCLPAQVIFCGLWCLHSSLDG